MYWIRYSFTSAVQIACTCASTPAVRFRLVAVETGGRIVA